jgi:rubrerythrin
MEYDKEKVRQWINEYTAAPQFCPVCNHSDWLLLDKVWELREFRAVPAAITAWEAARSPSVLPVVALMCNVCGYTIFFNAFAVRAVSRPTSQGG